MNDGYPSIAICGIGSVTVTIVHAFHQNKVPYTILCKDQNRLFSLQEKPVQFKGQNGDTTEINLKDHLTLVQENTETFDYIILGCKNQLLNEYLTLTKNHLKPNGKWILIQNGLPEEHFPNLKNKIISGVVGWNTQVLESGIYFQSNPGSLVLGGSDETKPNSIWKKSLEPWIDVVLTEHITGFRWHKLAINSIINGLAASKQLSLGQLFLNKKGRDQAITVLTEIKELMSKLQIKEGVVPGSFPIQKLGGGKGSLPIWIRHLVLILLGLKYFKIRTSMVQDLDHKRKTEIEFINGEVVNEAIKIGLPVPTNERIVKEVLKIESEFPS
ncbi:ketopantoate reductase family protein [Leptospira levettii]|uniref:ketopantoate reductase family protein n=1 Tax=Leptospira levettii TaxID=2023178 RepID=UPI0010926457|nr:ketopantoate reductase C-terminal domain-containing protein [Leptospira levettii]TGM75175.1 ketopantoate reductase family protein [Leptospira levettii]